MEHQFKDANLSYLYYFPSFDYLHLRLKNNVEFTLAAVEEDYAIISELKKEKNIYVLIDLRDISFEHIPKEVMSYLANNPKRVYQIKLAIIADSLSHKLLGNFYLSIFKPETKTKVFKNVKDAFKWFDFKDQEVKLNELSNALQYNG